MSNRITRGFHRLGIGASVLVVLAGAGLTTVATVDQYQSEMRAHERADATPGFVDRQTGYTLVPVDYDPFHSPTELGAKAAGIGLSITALLAFTAWGFFRGLGWVVAGFARD